ncbi:MAG: RNHCP domain-containing protein [Dehalococcoidia bacterium]
MCNQCGAAVASLKNGGYRNHCPACLYSRHLDLQPGDRAAKCRGMMEPIMLDHSSKKGWMIVHRCLRCGAIRRNRLADDREQPDALDAVIRLARQSAGGPA